MKPGYDELQLVYSCSGSSYLYPITVCCDSQHFLWFGESYCVTQERLELSRLLRHGNLNPACLPIPPQGQTLPAFQLL